ncbi:MAG: metallophosphoesterase [Candidatus Cyclobacteriaceae bacterium M2_1C_046]
MDKLLFVILLSIILLLLDVYIWRSAALIMKSWRPRLRQFGRVAFWVVSLGSIAVIWMYNLGSPAWFKGNSRSLILTFLFIAYFSKLFALLPLLFDDVVRGMKWIAGFFSRGVSEPIGGEKISRSEFISRSAIVMGALPLTTMSFGILSGAHDYRVRRKTVYLPNLPKEFEGITIGQLSDIHSGSFFNKTAVEGGIDMFLAEKPDMIFFTGDLVNNETKEVNEYFDIFKKLKAPHGVYSVTGNHDYGDYRKWPSAEAKNQNFKDLIEAHKEMGFDILMNENRYVEIGGERIAIIGVENWGKGRFQKFGDLEKATKNVEAPVKLLLSHDPSHWDEQIRPSNPDIDLTFSGHTHGFQFGIEIGDFQWSPSQYIYEQWGGLYRKDNQYIYVNRGFGYLGYPGRIGMAPELTIITLKRPEIVTSVGAA